jgi:hypothetical protein
MIFGGAALGSALAGLLVERSGPTAGLLVTAAAGLLATGRGGVGPAADAPGRPCGRRRRSGLASAAEGRA